MKKVFESFITFFIILVTISTIVEEFFSLFLSKYIDYFIYINFIFDFVFTLEFFIRVFISRKESGFLNYFTSGFGWIDFVASVPLLILSSGPLLYSYVFGDFDLKSFSFLSFINIIKIAKIVRVTRILRLLRFLKILKNIEFINSRIAQRHINYLVSLSITIVIVSVLVLNFLGINISSFAGNDIRDKYSMVLSSALDISIKTSKDFSKVAVDILSKDSDIIEVYFKNDKILSKNFELNFNHISYIEDFYFNNMKVYYINTPLIKLEAIFTLIIVFVVLFLSIGIVVVYSKKFALEISDPIIIVSNGLNKPDFFLKIREDYKHDDEVRELIDGYNSVWLTTKVKYTSEIYEGKMIDLDIELDDFLK